MKRLLLLSLVLLCSVVNAADHAVTSATSLVDCDTFDGGVNPGDTLTMDSGNRGKIKFQDCIGTSGNEIIIRNDTTAGGPTVIQKDDGSTGGFTFECVNCEFLFIDGTGKWSGAPVGTCGYFNGEEGRTQCGIKIEQITIQRPSVYMMFRGSSSDYEVRGVEIDGAAGTIGGAGLGHHLRDANYTLSAHPGEFRENIVYEKNYIHETFSTSLYIGPNQGLDELLLRNIEIKEILSLDIGRRGPTIKSATEGTNSIHHTKNVNTGLNGDISGFGHGLMIYEGGGSIYNNYVENAGEVGIECFHQALSSSFPTQPCEVYNNVVINAGATGPLSGRGINCGRTSTSAADFDCDFYNNTVINSESHGLSVNSIITTTAIIQDNISCDNGGSAVSASGHTVSSNQTGACSTQDFVNLVGLDLHITTTSPAKSDSVYFDPPSDDLDGVSRPQGADIDDGAYEFNEGGGGGEDITAPKPDSHTIDNLETHYPDHLWVLNEGATSLSEDDGSATDCDFTITGATWGSDGIGNYLTFDGAADFAENTTCTGFTGTITMCAIARHIDPEASDVIGGLFDNSDADQGLSIALTGPVNAYNQASAITSGNAATAFNGGIPTTDDNKWNMLCTRQSITTNDFSTNGAAWDTSAETLTDLLTGLDTVAIGGKRRTVGSNFFTGDILAFWIYDNTSKSDAEIATIHNNGDPWAIIGVDPGAGPPPVAQRGHDSFSEGLTN